MKTLTNTQKASTNWTYQTDATKPNPEKKTTKTARQPTTPKNEMI